MVMVLGDSPGQSKIAATDSESNLLTDIERLDYLFTNGQRFEATVAQMALIEALLLFYLKAKIQSEGAKVKEDLEKLHKNRKLTFGKVKDIVIKNNVLHDEAIKPDLVKYVSYRNDLAHNLIGSFSSVDLDDFYARGQRLADFFHAYLLLIVKHHNR